MTEEALKEIQEFVKGAEMMYLDGVLTVTKKEGEQNDSESNKDD